MSVTSVTQLMKEMDEVLSAGGGGSGASVASSGSKAKNAAVAALEAKAAAALAQKQALQAAKDEIKALTTRFDDMKDRLAIIDGRRTGISDGLGWIAAICGIAFGIAMLFKK